ncbi:MAG TPA: metallophosphoesterase [Paenirhodobacter sp.]
MTRLLHLTDLHFGLERDDLIAPLHQAIRAANPDLVIVSGDLTHRARAGQFDRAMAFLRGLNLPFIAVPGNHDVPLINLFARFLFPFRDYRRAVSADMTPSRTLGPLRIVSANTADPHSWRRGVLRNADLRRICAEQAGIGVLVCHHPLREPPGFDRGETRGATAGLAQMARAGVQIVLSGHLHHWAVGLGISADTPQPILQVQTGTALCARIGEKNHGFAVLDIAPDDVAVTPWLAQDTVFHPAPVLRFQRREGAWWPNP